MGELSNFAAFYQSSMREFRVKDTMTVLRCVAISIG